MKKLFKYTGLICESMSYGQKVDSIILHDLRDEDKAPTRLEVLGDMREYVYSLEMTDAEERYIYSDYYYDSNLFLIKIEIPSTKPGIPAKVIAIKEATCNYDMVIFGKSEFIDSDKPEPLSREEYQSYLDYKIGN